MTYASLKAAEKAVEAMKTIRFYRATGEYGFMSNLYKWRMVFEGQEFTCAETAYQFGKPKDRAVAEWLISAPKPHLCAVAAHALLAFDIRPDWNAIKVDRMKAVLEAKFTQHEDLKQALLNTGDATLIEDSKTDSFWGTGSKGVGQNTLGRLLIDLRHEFWKGS
jgi:ribA/ribD-fused uncharacterized protein